ncbi:MAG: hypothetical protein RLY31_258 [Bacteroidota bacterium]|jgi:GNAT superfamily N-acetyltransferase
MMKTTLKLVDSKDSLHAFVQFPFDLYGKHPFWVPPIIQSETNTLSADKNPAFSHCETVLFVAERQGKVVGRVAGIVNHLETEHTAVRQARFGWLDFIDDRSVAAALLDAVSDWAARFHCKQLKGPYGFNQLDRNGMLTEGFDSMGTANTAYNHPYYPEHLQSLGFEPDLRWVELMLYLPPNFPERLTSLSRAAAGRYGLRVFQPEGKGALIRMTDALFELLLDTYQQLPGFVPLSQLERYTYIRQYIRILRMDLVRVVVDADNRPIGFGVTMPSLSNALRRARGKLFPWGLFHLAAAKQWNDTAELALIGVREEWRRKGVHALIFSETGQALIRSGMRTVRINPMLETNTSVLSLWKDFDHRIYKRRMTFRRSL